MTTVTYPRVRNRLPFFGIISLLLVLAVSVLWGPIGERLALPTPAPKYRGGVLETPVALPALTLQRADGKPFGTSDLLGRTSLFYFGYTRCPDVCPLSLANIAAARKQLGANGADVDAYFVTVDPTRDTPDRLREYTANFDRTVGLTGTPDQLAAAYGAFGVVAQRRDDGARTGDYFVDHTAHTFLVDPAGKLRIVFPYPTAPPDIAADLSTLAAARTIRVVDPWVRAVNRSATGAAVSAAYFQVENTGRAADRLLGVESDAADEVDVHRTATENGVMRMAPADDVDIGAAGRLAAQPGGLHVMLTGLRRDLTPGSEVVLTLHFARAGDVVVRAVARA